MSSQTVYDLTLYLVLWSGLFIVLRNVVFRKFSPTFSNVAVSWVHAWIALRLGSLAVDWRHPLSNYGTTTSPEQVRLTEVTQRNACEQ